ncbi:Protein kinase domain/Protein tyrosine kinase, putative [Angomonas deanei]|uniref:cyclin-dependent kinase n=1 Tax=Angomonas deanei TaxID=59799 RepID=A0A7G2CJ97_9TRYP|nr:Protein kinase domain/Protein tyrosine kinase, putative [Angomonas deanei]
MENYELLERVGEGTYGVVLKCRHKKSDTIVAVKRFKQSETNEYVRCTMMREVCVQRLLKGEPNVVQLLETFMENGKLFLVMEYFQGSLLNLLDEQPDGLDLDKLRLLIYTLITGVHSCHSNGVVHRDIKPENILMKSDYSAYLCDFGFARPISTGKSPSKDGKVSRNSDVLSGLVRPGIGDGSMTVYVATRWYRSPEMLLAMEHYDYSVDMWAVGAIMAEAADGAPLLPGRSELEMISLIQERIGVLPADYQALVTGGTKSGIKMTRNPLEPKSHSPRSYLKERYASRIGEDGVDLLRKLLAIQATDRITAEEALCHPFFEKMAHQEKRTKSPVSLSNEREEGESICSESTSHSAKQDSPIMSTSTTPLQVNLTTVEEQSPKPTFNVSYGAKEECSKKRASLPTVLSPSNNVFHHSRIRSDELPFSNDKDGPSTHMSAGSPVTSRTSSRRRKPFKGFVNSSNNTLDSIYGKSRPPKHEKGKRASTAQGKRRESKTSSSSVKETALTVRTPSAVNTPKKKANRSKKVGTARYMSTTRRKVNKPSKSEKPLLLQELESLSHPVTAPNSTEVMEGTPNPKAANAARQHKEQQLGSSVHSGSESAEREHHAVTIEKLTDEGSCSALSVDSQTECGAYEKKMRKMQEMGMEDSVGPVEPPNRGNVFFRKRSSCSPSPYFRHRVPRHGRVAGSGGIPFQLGLPKPL